MAATTRLATLQAHPAAARVHSREPRGRGVHVRAWIEVGENAPVLQSAEEMFAGCLYGPAFGVEFKRLALVVHHLVADCEQIAEVLEWLGSEINRRAALRLRA